jgi:hypothetical protein
MKSIFLLAFFLFNLTCSKLFNIYKLNFSVAILTFALSDEEGAQRFSIEITGYKEGDDQRTKPFGKNTLKFNGLAIYNENETGPYELNCSAEDGKQVLKCDGVDVELQCTDQNDNITLMDFIKQVHHNRRKLRRTRKY